MLFARLFARRDSRSSFRSFSHARRPAAHRHRASRPPHVESLEDRTLLSGWAFAVGPAADVGRAVAVDSAGNSYITGKFHSQYGARDFDPGPGTSNLTAIGGQDIFIAKYSPTGSLVWARRAGGSADTGTGSQRDEGWGIAVDSAGRVFVTGQFYVQAGFGPFTLTSVGGADIFVTALDSSGNFLWARSVGGASSDSGRAVAVEGSGAVLVTGNFSDTADFDPGPGVFNLTSVGGADAFVWKLDSAGNLVSAVAVGSAGVDVGRGIAVDATGNAHIVGDFHDTVAFGSTNLTSAGGPDIFVAKLDATGNWAWARRAGGIYDDGRVPAYDGGSMGIGLDSAGNVYATGSFRSVADFGPFTLTGVNDPGGAPSDDVFVTKLVLRQP